MQTYYFGRFSISVPEGFKFKCQKTVFRRCEIRDYLWESNSHELESKQFWENRIAEITKLKKPDEVDKIILEIRDLPELGKNAKGVFYYGNSAFSDLGYWDIFIDKDRTAFLLSYDGRIERKEFMLKKVIEIGKSYQPLPPEGPSHLPTGNWFYTKKGAINMPYYLQESTELNLYHEKLDLDLVIKTMETNENEPEGHNLIGRVAAIIASGYARGVKVDRLRTVKRELAGFKGEEEDDRMTDKTWGPKLDFCWRYPGRADSGEFPEIMISIESRDGDLDEKLKIWDAILESFKPMYNAS